MSLPTLRLGAEDWARIRDHALRDYPSECCGVILRSKTGRCEVRPCANIQDRLHERLPKEHPRDSRTAYRMDDMEMLRVLTEADQSGRSLAGFYHSHIDCEAYFSAEDQAAALFGETPAYPETVHLVLSVFEGEVRGHRAFAWDGSSGDYQETPILNE